MPAARGLIARVNREMHSGPRIVSPRKSGEVYRLFLAATVQDE